VQRNNPCPLCAKSGHRKVYDLVLGWVVKSGI
jgi:hypothetical protein